MTKFKAGDIVTIKGGCAYSRLWRILYIDDVRALLVSFAKKDIHSYDWKTSTKTLEEEYELAHAPAPVNKRNKEMVPESKFKVGDLVIIKNHYVWRTPKRILYMDDQTVLLEREDRRNCGYAIEPDELNRRYELYVAPLKPLEVDDIISVYGESGTPRKVVFFDENVILLRELANNLHTTYGMSSLHLFRYEDGSKVGKPVFNKEKE